MDQSEVFNPDLFTEEEYNLFYGKSLVPSLVKKTKTLGARLKNSNEKDLKVPNSKPVIDGARRRKAENVLGEDGNSAQEQVQTVLR